eukprot:CAMPEP_0173200352 /NCGR_PEP_ID=MMETSP1141-20130122/17742_1 /TAXON_ID=483371 /ORGANISM="non described non described, Strain CCMP2298" /LENGTH=93 /DNA_ID=CAMNT_0014125341 /DNA_START=51 /DNA_END=332 /DNA_ORIENTATION=-
MATCPFTLIMSHSDVLVGQSGVQVGRPGLQGIGESEGQISQCYHDCSTYCGGFAWQDGEEQRQEILAHDGRCRHVASQSQGGGFADKGVGVEA